MEAITLNAFQLKALMLCSSGVQPQTAGLYALLLFSASALVFTPWIFPHQTVRNSYRSIIHWSGSIEKIRLFLGNA